MSKDEARARRRSMLPLGIAAGAAAVLLVGGLMVWRADARTNKVALASRPKPVTVVRAQAATYRPTRMYVGTLQPWVQAAVGPQFVSAYVSTVLVRPGATVKKGEVLATLDCREVSASTRAVEARARALDARQQAIAHEATRTQGLLDGGYVSPNEAEQKSALSKSEAAQLEAERANLARSALEVSDCVMRAPFSGEIAQRTMDPGAFVRPGNTIVTVVDRDIVRLTADAPEMDFDVVKEGTKVAVHLYATKRDVPGTITRRSPAADPATRTVHFEIDIADPARTIPVGTTGEVRIEVGTPSPATAIPLYAATVRRGKAKLFVVERSVAHARDIPVQGEAAGSLFLDRALAPDVLVVSEGRGLLKDGDAVAAKELPLAEQTLAPIGGAHASRELAADPAVAVERRQ